MIQLARARVAVAVSTAVVVLAAAVVRVGGAGAGVEPSAFTPQQIDFFETKVRPVLAGACYDCHADEVKGDLRLDSRAAILRGGESGPAVVPGDPDASLLMQAVRHAPGVAKMPRRSDKLSDAHIDALAEWIRMGLPWPASPAGADAEASAAATPNRSAVTDEHRAFWSFRPLAAPPLPDVGDAAWPKTDIDRFVLARLEREGLKPVRAADRRTLIRRATLALTGLPPTPEEVDAFVNDPSADAFDAVIDRLLASPRYGETWGRLWLDVARYGEDDPRSLDPERRGYAPYPNAYLYRDWVVKAFNDDLPYDQFIRAQLAADLLDERVRVRMLPALGFLGLGPWYYDNGSVEITRADERHDRVDVVSRGFLGLTVACSRCHDHKYDPIPARDYYAMAGVFLNTTYHEYPLVPQALVDERTALEKRQKDTQKLLGEIMRSETRQLAETLAFQASRYMQAAWKVTGEPKEDAQRIVSREKLDYELFDRWLKFLAKPPHFYPFLEKWQAMVKAGGSVDEAKTLGDEFQSLLVEVMFQQKEIHEENEIIRAKALPGTKKKEPANLPHEFVTNDDFCPGCGLELKALPTERMHLWADVFSHDLRPDQDPFQSMEEPPPGLLVFRGWTLERWLGGDRRRFVEDLRKTVEEAKKAMPPKFAYLHGVREAEQPQDLRFHVRGNPMKLGDPVPRHFLAVLSDGEPAPFTQGSGRLELADAIVAEPITMRVIVNRVWKWHFGTGLVDTTSNFGTIGERPTNPELLEHLAHGFRKSGMSLKALHREIMRSAAYQSSADHSAENAAKDSGNRLYWRTNRQRKSAEQIRDALLFVSGTLDETIGGPSAPLTTTFARRTVYGHVSRYKLDQFLQLFDFPTATISAEGRFTTHVPLQRLFLMNSDFVQQQAEHLARRVAGEPDNRARIRGVYRLLYGRDPDETELAAGLAFLSEEPLRAYEERRAVEAKPGDGAATNGTGAKPAAAAVSSPAEKDPAAKKADGMMAGVVPGAGDPEERTQLLPVTPFGRYVKVLFGSTEFLFVD
jgi:hypothetical protein